VPSCKPNSLDLISGASFLVQRKGVVSIRVFLYKKREHKRKGKRALFSGKFL